VTLPNFLVIGAQRAGTSLLHKILAEHPEVYVPTERKEIHFFDWYFERGTDWYQGYFPAPAEAARFRAIGEVTPDYLIDPEAPARIQRMLPGARLVAILRNPVDRAYSWYQYARRSRNEQRNFERFLEEDPMALEAGFYHRHLTRYLAHVPSAQLHLMIYEDLVREPARKLDALAAFLGLQRGWQDPAAAIANRVNSSEIPKYRGAYAAARNVGKVLMRNDLNWPVRVAKQLGIRSLFGRVERDGRLSDGEKSRLAACYRDDVAALSELLGREQPVWRI
jgi:hypothetical protein